MIKSFSKFIGKMTPAPVPTAPVKSAVVVWGEFNPPTREHLAVLEAAEKKAKKIGAHLYIYTTPHTDRKKRPLLYEDKIKFLRQAFPRFGRAIQRESTTRSALQALNNLRADGYTKIDMVNLGGCSDLTPESMNEDFQDGFVYHNCAKKAEEKTMRDYVLKENFAAFVKMSPFATREKSKSLYNATRAGLGLRESTSDTFRPKFVKPVTEDRETFYERTFTIGEQVVIKKSSETVTVKSIGCNYIIVEHANNTTSSVWPKQLR